MTTMIGTGLVSGDSHVNEPRNLWRDNLPARFRDQAMRGIQAGDDGNWDLVLEGHHLDKTTAEEAERMLVADPAHRYQVMHEEGIVAECIFPTIGLYVWMLSDPDGGAASCRVYNEWIADRLGGSPRFKCAGLVPTWRVEDAVEEVAWIAEAGLGSLMLPAVVTPDWNHRTWAPLWSAIAESGLPAVVHQGTGPQHVLLPRARGRSVQSAGHPVHGPQDGRPVGHLGGPRLPPRLHVVFVEYNVGWLGWAMQTLDYYQEAFSEAGFTPEGKKWVNVELPLPPSHYLRQQVHATFQDDPIGIHNVAYTGPDVAHMGVGLSPP